MFSINGTGLRFYGYTKPNSNGEVKATVWLSFFFLPLVPLYRKKIKPISYKGSSLNFTDLGKVPMSIPSILKTYFFGWMIMPFIMFFPLALAVKEVQQKLGIPENFQWILMTFGICWLIGATWRLKSWDEKRVDKTHETDSV